jgi:hypothetical protein
VGLAPGRALFFESLPGRSSSDEIQVELEGFEKLQGSPEEKP